MQWSIFNIVIGARGNCEVPPTIAKSNKRKEPKA